MYVSLQIKANCESFNAMLLHQKDCTSDICLYWHGEICFFVVDVGDVCWIRWEYVDSAMSHSTWALRSHIFGDLSIFYSDKFTNSADFSESSQSYGPWQVFAW